MPKREIAPNRRDRPQQKRSIAHTHLRFIHSTYAVVLKFLAPAYTLNNLNRRLQVWPRRQMGDLRSKGITYCQDCFRYQCCSFPIVVTRSVLPAWKNYALPTRSTGHLTADLCDGCDTALSHELPTRQRSGSLVWEQSLRAGHILGSRISRISRDLVSRLFTFVRLKVS